MKIDIYKYANKNMLKVLKKEKKLSKDQKPSKTLKQMRQNYNKSRIFWNEGGYTCKIVEKTIMTKMGKTNVRFLYPQNHTDHCCIFIHGGGYIVGNPQTHDRLTRNFAYEARCVVAVIDYHLSPEYKFPSALYECIDLIKYIQKNAKKLNLNSKNISFAGDSAGANMALGLSLLCQDEKIDIKINSLVLYYGLYGLKDSLSRRILGGEYDGCSEKDMKYYEKMYLKNKKDRKSPYYDNLNANLSNCPPVYMAVGSLDPLQDDSKALKKLLKIHNIKHKLEIYKGITHAFLHYSKILPEATNAIKNGGKFLQNALKETK